MGFCLVPIIPVATKWILTLSLNNWWIRHTERGTDGKTERQIDGGLTDRKKDLYTDYYKQYYNCVTKKERDKT